MSRPYRDLAWKSLSLLFVLLAGVSISSAQSQDPRRTAADKLIAEAEALTEKRTEQSYQRAFWAAFTLQGEWK
jgi:hypothetical protein